ncbi:hypothetical protein IMSAGC022_01321 [Alistipes sp.]|nr:hypothetical protein IMSAGC022_01321 [Alistipes sp.]
MTTDIASTSSGTTVSMIEPSIGDVRDRPYISSSLRAMPMTSAARNMILMSLRSIFSLFCHSNGINEKRAVTISEADTIATGEM